MSRQPLVPALGKILPTRRQINRCHVDAIASPLLDPGLLIQGAAFFAKDVSRARVDAERHHASGGLRSCAARSRTSCASSGSAAATLAYGLTVSHSARPYGRSAVLPRHPGNPCSNTGCPIGRASGPRGRARVDSSGRCIGTFDCCVAIGVRQAVGGSQWVDARSEDAGPGPRRQGQGLDESTGRLAPQFVMRHPVSIERKSDEKMVPHLLASS